MRVTRQEPVAVLGIGAMGHGIATSALRAGIPTVVWNAATLIGSTTMCEQAGPKRSVRDVAPRGCGT
jgi:3-hydroxyisobutyrate dehydrogenase-like beta-hydroxyacid dehydrogenase